MHAHATPRNISTRRLLAAAWGLLLPSLALGQAPTITGFTPTIGPSGTVVTISGTNLTNTKAVLINGLSVVVSNKTAATVSFVVPPAAASGKLRLTTAGGTALSGARFLVQRPSSASTTTAQTGAGNGVSGLPAAAGGYSTPVATDLDNNGLIDLLVGDANGNIVRYEQTIINGAFSTTGAFLTAGGASLKVTNYAKPTVTDLDGNGLLDLLVGSGTGQRVVRYEQTAVGAASFTLIGNLKTTASGTPDITSANFPKPAISDLDGNGLLDMILGDDNGQLRRYEQATVNGGSFVDRGLLTANTPTNSTFSTIDVGFTSKPLVSDFDGDGLLDMLVGTRAGNIVRFSQTALNATTFTQIGNIQAGGADITVGTGGANANYAAPTITDLDGDGNIDLLFGSNDGLIVRYEQNAAAPVPLPVVLVSFTGKATAAGTQLSWATAQEVNSARFVVERSTDGRRFEAIAELAAAGNSGPRSYGYLDAAAPALSASLSYYRLRQEDRDGTTAYSAVVSVGRKAAAGSAPATAYPNPFRDVLQVALPGNSETQPATVVLMSATGQPVYRAQLQLGATSQALPVADLAPGVYLLRLTTASGTTTQRVSH